MLTHLRAAPRQAPPAPPQQPPEPTAALLDAIGSIEDEDHILVLGKDGLDLMCALLRAGAAQVTHLCSHERPEADSASLVLVPHVASLDWLASTLPSIRRTLMANGRVVARVATQFTSRDAVRRVLTQHGFSAIRTQSTADGQVVSAELPAFGLRRCA